MIRNNKSGWVDVCRPTKEEYKHLSRKFSIPEKELIFSKSEHPTTNSYKKYSCILINVVSKEKKITPLAIFLTDNGILTIRHKELSCLNDPNLLSHTKFVYSILTQSIEDYFEALEAIEGAIDKIESDLFRKNRVKDIHEDFLQNLFNIKTSLIFYHKALIGNREVVNAILDREVKRVKDDKMFRETYNDLIQLVDLEETFREILSGAIDTYMSVSSHKLNKIVKTLTIITAFVMIPTLITSFYGMNFQFIPGFNWRYGHWMVIFMIIISVGLMYFYFKKKDWL